MRFVMKSLAAAGAVVILASGTAVAAPPDLPKPDKKQATSKKVPASLMGMHVHSLTTTAPTAEDRFGGIRIWDNGVRWDQVNTAKDVYDWTTLDQVVANARATGAQDIMYVLGYTPVWAAKNVKPPCTPGNYTNCEYFPGGSSSGPKDLEDWKTWVREVATRYKGQITQYQMWNEANLTAMFSNPSGDSAVEMAQLTVAAQQVIGTGLGPGAKHVNVIRVDADESRADQRRKQDQRDDAAADHHVRVAAGAAPEIGAGAGGGGEGVGHLSALPAGCGGRWRHRADRRSDSPRHRTG